MQLYSQRDQRWGYKQLGTSETSTIYSHGCTITCIAMMADIRPDEVNERLKKVGGYARTNLVIWSKIHEAIPWLDSVKRVWNYNNTEVAANTPTLVEVDGSRIGSERHWVLYTGDQKMSDPWYGTEKSTNYYAPLGYTLIKRVGDPPGGSELSPSDPMIYKGLDLNNPESMKVAVDSWFAIKEGEYISKAKVAELREEWEAEKKKLQSMAVKKQEQYDRLIQRLAELLGTTGDVADIEAEIEKLVVVGDQLITCRSDKSETQTKLDSKTEEMVEVLAELSQLTGLTVKTKEGISKALASYLKNNNENPKLEDYSIWERIRSLFVRR